MTIIIKLTIADNYVHPIQPDAKSIGLPNCDISFANGKLHQEYGHVKLMISS